MTGSTHRAGGMLCSVVGFMLLKSSGVLLTDVNEALQFAVIYPFCMWGSVASDFDHNWDSCPNKDIPSWCVNKALHITTPLYKKLDNKLTGSEKKKSVLYKSTKLLSANHRSWQTHSDLTLFCMLWLLYSASSGRFNDALGGTDVAILSLVLTGISLGIIAHFILDMLTPSGVWCTVGVVLNGVLGVLSGKSVKFFPEKLRFVPKAKRFATGSDWETFVRKVLKVLTVLAVLYVLLGIAFPDLIPSIIDAIPFQISFK